MAFSRILVIRTHRNEEYNAAVQKALFALGCQWQSGTQKLQYLNSAERIRISIDGRLASGSLESDSIRYDIDVAELVLRSRV